MNGKRLPQYYRRKHNTHCVKSVRTWSYSGPFLPAFGLNKERYFVYLHIQCGCGKIRQNNSEYGHFSRSDNDLELNTDSISQKTVTSFSYVSFDLGKIFGRLLLTASTTRSFLNPSPPWGTSNI